MGAKISFLGKENEGRGSNILRNGSGEGFSDVKGQRIELVGTPRGYRKYVGEDQVMKLVFTIGVLPRVPERREGDNAEILYKDGEMVIVEPACDGRFPIFGRRRG